MLYRTSQEYESAIADTQNAIKRILLIGQETENNSGGSSRKMQDADLEKLEKFLSRLQIEYDKLLSNNMGGFIVKAGW